MIAAGHDTNNAHDHDDDDDDDDDDDAAAAAAGDENDVNDVCQLVSGLSVQAVNYACYCRHRNHEKPHKSLTSTVVNPIRSCGPNGLSLPVQELRLETEAKHSMPHFLKVPTILS